VTEGLLGLVERCRAAVAEFRPEAYSGEDCAVLAEAIAGAEKACAAARVRAAARAGSCGAHRDRGFAAASDWLGRLAGTSAAAAKAALDTAAALEHLPEAKMAMEAGDLSMAQAHELVKTEAACAGSAAELLAVATGESLKSLKEQGRGRRQRVMSPEELHAAQHRAKVFRHWRTGLGTVGFAGELPPEIGVPLMNRLDAETDRLWKQARRQAKAAAGEPEVAAGAANGQQTRGIGPVSVAERRSALAADAFVRLVETGGNGKARSADLVIVCDLEAYRRGHALEGESCHIVGGGPIPVSLARELGRDAFLKAVLHNGTDISTIAHFGRKTSAVLHTALMLGAPPHFDGIKCSVPGCDRRYYLEQDHIDPVANGGLTAFENMRPLCWLHHLIKTEQDRKAGLLQGKRRKRRRRPGYRGTDPP
jgi:HNH endonuclease